MLSAELVDEEVIELLEVVEDVLLTALLLCVPWLDALLVTGMELFCDLHEDVALDEGSCS